jgi:hypothetical protein
MTDLLVCLATRRRMASALGVVPAGVAKHRASCSGGGAAVSCRCLLNGPRPCCTRCSTQLAARWIVTALPCCGCPALCAEGLAAAYAGGTRSEGCVCFELLGGGHPRTSGWLNSGCCDARGAQWQRAGSLLPRTLLVQKRHERICQPPSLHDGAAAAAPSRTALVGHAMEVSWLGQAGERLIVWFSGKCFRL